MSGYLKALKGVAAAAALLFISQAHAASVLTSASTLSGFGGSITTAIVGQQVDQIINVTGITSVAVAGTAGNTVLSFNVGAGSSVVGIGWDVNNTATSPSWLSEMAVGFRNTDNTGGVNLTVGQGDDLPGTKSYSSGGVLDLIGLGLSFTANANGLVRVEFYESFNDPEVNPDGIWNSGSLTLRVVPVPEPATYGMMALGLLAMGAFVRRRNA